MALTNGVNGTKAAVPGVEHGVASSLSLLQSFLAAHPDVKFIRYYVLDYCGMLRTRFSTTARALQIASQPHTGPRTGSPIISLGLQSGGALFELFQSGDDVWVPDWTSLRHFAASKGTATVMCSVEEHNREAEGLESMLKMDPRAQLSRVVADAKAKHDVDFLIGFEIEFMLVTGVDATEPIASPDGVWTANTIRTPEWTSVVEECVLLFEAAGVHVWSFCPEGGKSKYEIALSPLPPLEACDALQFAHETIKTVAKKAGCYATMHAKPFETGLTAGKHIHLSLSKSELGTSFLAGVLKHFRALCAFMQSNIESYQRLEHFGGGIVSWGWHKLACVHRIQDAYYEIRTPDSFGNIYLMLAAILGVGMEGVADKEELTLKAVDEMVFKGAPTEEQKKKWNIVHDLPKNLEESVKDLKVDETLKRVLGEKVHERYVYNKEKDIEESRKLTTAARRRVLLDQF